MAKDKSQEVWSIVPEGHYKRLICRGVRSFCGQCEGDGISFYFEGEGSWVISYKDFNELYKKVKEARKNTPYKTWEEVIGNA